MARLAYGLAALVGVGAAALGLHGMFGGAFTLQVGWLVPLGGLQLTLDPLAGFFLLVIAVGVAPASVYAIGSAAARGAVWARTWSSSSRCAWCRWPRT